jgi:hypothetical protein
MNGSIDGGTEIRKTGAPHPQSGVAPEDEIEALCLAVDAVDGDTLKGRLNDIQARLGTREECATDFAMACAIAHRLRNLYVTEVLLGDHPRESDALEA